MRSKGFVIGSAMVAAMVCLSVATFLETAQPVQAQPIAAGDSGSRLLCPTGASGVPSTCAEVHAQALAAGTMSRVQFDFAQSQLVALAAHPSGS